MELDKRIRKVIWKGQVQIVKKTLKKKCWNQGRGGIAPSDSNHTTKPFGIKEMAHGEDGPTHGREWKNSETSPSTSEISHIK